MEIGEGKVAFITGGGSGAGLGQAKVLSAAGCKVVIADIRRDHLDQATAELRARGAQVHPIKLDITDSETFKAATDEAEAVFGPVQLLFNTAGVSIFGPLERATDDDAVLANRALNLTSATTLIFHYFPIKAIRKSRKCRQSSVS